VEPEPFELFGFIVDESTLLGRVIAEVFDIPWYVGLLWMCTGMVFILVFLFILLILWSP